MREQFSRVPYNPLIKKLYICNIPLSESEEYDIWWILSMYSLLRVSLYCIVLTRLLPIKVVQVTKGTRIPFSQANGLIKYCLPK